MIKQYEGYSRIKQKWIKFEAVSIKQAIFMNPQFINIREIK